MLPSVMWARAYSSSAAWVSSSDSSAWGYTALRPLYWPSFTSGYRSMTAVKVKPSGPMVSTDRVGVPAIGISSG